MANDKDGDLPTYKKAMIQIVAYKRIRAVVNGVLERFDINTTQWIILGVLYESATGLRITDIAHSLEVEVPLITRLSHGLLGAGLVRNDTASQDKRAKPLRLTERGLRLIGDVELELLKRTKRLEKGLSSREIHEYFRTLETFMDNSANSSVH